MSQSKCCTCNGANAKCIGCRCARNKIACTSCYPRRHGRCGNPASADISELSEHSARVSFASSDTEQQTNLPNFTSQEAIETGDESDLIRNVVIKLRQCRSSLVKHIPKGARHLFAKVLTNAIEKALSQNDIDSWIRLVILPTLCLRSPPHNGKRHSSSLCTHIKEQINTFENERDTFLLLHYLEPTKSGLLKKKQPLSDIRLRKTISDKLSEGDVRGALRFLASEETLAPYSPSTLSQLRLKHPDRPPDRRPYPEVASPPIVIVESQVLKAINSFPPGSSGGITRLRPLHLKEVLRSDVGHQRELLLFQLTAFVNRIISNQLPVFIMPVLLGANLTALNKKNGGIRPIAVGETIRRIACKCAMRQVEPQLTSLLTPLQLGCGVRAGLDAAIHSTRDKLHSDIGPQLFLKLDFRNAFNSIRRDHIADCLQTHIPSLGQLFNACYSEPTFLTFGDEIFLSDEGLQQGDPLAPAYFCVGLHNILCDLKTPFKTAYLDDISLLGNAETVLHDLLLLKPACENIGLLLNSDKCELTFLGEPHVSEPCQQIYGLLPNLKQLPLCEANLLGAAMGDVSLETLLKEFLTAFNIMTQRLLKLSAHDALFLLRTSLSMPKLLHTLRTSPAFTRPDLLSEIDALFSQTLSSVLNVNLTPPQISQVSLPVKLGGFGIPSSLNIAPSAFLSSLHAANPTCVAISPEWCLEDNTSYREALTLWESKYPTVPKPIETLDRQKTWTSPLHLHQVNLLLTSAVDQDRARLLACKAQGSGEWLNALPSASLGLHLSDDQLRTAAAVRLGAPVSLEHFCSSCGSISDGRGQHALCCPKSTGRHLRHRLMNDVISRALHSISIPTRLEPTGLLPDSNLKPDGISLIPWSSGKPLAWDVTCAHPLAQSWRGTSLRNEAAVATAVEAKKISKYKGLEVDFHFEPVSVETLGGMGSSTSAFIQYLGGRISAATGDPRSTSYLKQRLAIAIQVGNYACFAASLPSPGPSLPPTIS